MQDLQQFTNKILEKATAESKQIEAAAQKKREERIVKEKQRLEEEKAQKIQQFKITIQNKNAERIRLQKETNQADRALYLQKALDRCFEKAEEILNAQTQEDFLIFFESALSKLDQQGEYTIILGEKTAEKINVSVLDELHIPEGVSLAFSSETIPNEGGIVLRRGKVEYVFLYRQLLQEVKKEKGSKLLKKLFA